LVGGPSTKLVEMISLKQQLGSEFFRPKSQEFDAAVHFHDPLLSAKKVGANWEVQLKGAEEPDRATVLLDSNFKLLSVTRNPAAH